MVNQGGWNHLYDVLLLRCPSCSRSTTFQRCLTCPAVTWAHLDSTHVTWQLASKDETLKSNRSQTNHQAMARLHGRQCCRESPMWGYASPRHMLLISNWFPPASDNCIQLRYSNLDYVSLCFKCLTLFSMRSAIL